MNILEKIKNVFGKNAIIGKDKVDRLMRLPKGQARKEFAALVHELCVKRTGEFVKGELQRPDSPYQGLSASVFFHEILSVTYWLVIKETGGDELLRKELDDLYFSSYPVPDMAAGDRGKALAGKYDQYEDFWNEITGHLDEFGLLVVRNMFGSGESAKTRERTFWIIQYADEATAAFAPLKKVWKKISSVA